MKKLLIVSGFLFLGAVYSCGEKKEAKGTVSSPDSPSVSTTVTGDSVTKLDATIAKNMIKHFKSDQVTANRAKLFKGSVNVSKLTSLLNGAASFNIFSAAYLDSNPDSLKKNMPTYILQVKSSGTSTEATYSYYVVDEEVLCPPPPDCNTVITES